MVMLFFWHSGLMVENVRCLQHRDVKLEVIPNRQASNSVRHAEASHVACFLRSRLLLMTQQTFLTDDA